MRDQAPGRDRVASGAAGCPSPARAAHPDGPWGLGISARLSASRETNLYPEAKSGTENCLPPRRVRAGWSELGLVPWG